MTIAIYLSTVFCLMVSVAHASEFNFQQTQNPQRSYLLAQADGDDSYDPFADYSEFDEAADEEADIHFFRNGRFFTLGLAVGMRDFTGTLKSLYSSGPSYGVFMTYFFDLNLALQFGFITGDYDYHLDFQDGGLNYTTTGNVSLTMLNFHLKYYMNTQNVTKGLADLNPYFIGGASQVYRTYTISGADGFAKDAVVGVDFGGGIEIPMMRRKSFLGIQGMYHYAKFKDQNSPLIGVKPDGTLTQTQVKPKGDNYSILGIIGLNF
jgi:hypothetical protein